MPHNPISVLIKGVSEAIIEEYGEDLLSCPTTPDQWRAIADIF